MNGILDTLKKGWKGLTAENGIGDNPNGPARKTGGTVTADSRKLSNQIILDKITEVFHNDLRENSFEDTVVFPMTFTVAMAQKDYETFKGYRPAIVQQAIKKFYRIIKQEMGETRSCDNLATYWDISFIPCIPDVTEIDEQTINVPEGSVIVLAAVNDTIEDIMKSEGGVRVSVTVSGTDAFENVNINRDMLRNMNVRNNAHFQINWDRNMSPDFRKPEAVYYTEQSEPVKQDNGPAAAHGLAELTCIYNGSRTGYVMERNMCILSGSRDTREDGNIIKLPCKVVRDGHVTIEYIPNEDKFMMAAFGNTIMNGNRIRQSTGGDVKWVQLPDEADLNLCGSVMVKFRKVKA